jgi:hypothetical protein
VLIKNRALFVTGLTLLLFHLANAALLPMLSMRVAAPPRSTPVCMRRAPLSSLRP